MRKFIIISSIIILNSCCSNHLAVYKKDGKFGCINKKGVWIIQPIWDYILLDDKGKPNLVERNSLYGFIKRNGQVLIQPKFNDAELFNEGLALVANAEDKYGYINLKGDTVINFKYDENAWGEFSNGLADVVVNGRSGYIDKKGKIKVPLIYEICYPFRSDIAVVMDSTYNLKLIDKNGNLLDYSVENIGKNQICPPLESYPGSIESEMGKGRINNNGDTIIPPIYKVTVNEFDKMFLVQNELKKWGAYNRSGRLIVEIKFDKLSTFNHGAASFKLNDKWGFINKKGEIIIEPIYDYASSFSRGLAYVEIDSVAGFINYKGEEVIPITLEPYRTWFE